MDNLPIFSLINIINRNRILNWSVNDCLNNVTCCGRNPCNCRNLRHTWSIPSNLWCSNCWESRSIFSCPWTMAVISCKRFRNNRIWQQCYPCITNIVNRFCNRCLRWWLRLLRCWILFINNRYDNVTASLRYCLFWDTCLVRRITWDGRWLNCWKIRIIFRWPICIDNIASNIIFLGSTSIRNRLNNIWFSSWSIWVYVVNRPLNYINQIFSSCR